MGSHAPLPDEQIAEFEAMAREEAPPRRVVTSTSFADIPMATARWLWEDRIPLGNVTLLVGDPGLGKSMLTCLLAAKVSRGEIGDGPHNVLMLTAEDAPDVQVRPRLLAAGGDLELIHNVAARTGDMPDGIRLPDDIEELDRLVKDRGATLVVVDPLMAHLESGINAWSDHSIRTAMSPLFRLAAETDSAVLLVGHLNKSKGSDPLYRTGGSIGISAAVRSALVLMRDPDDPEGDRGSQRVLAQSKSNYGALAASLSYAVETEHVGTVAMPVLRRTGESHHTAADLLDAPSGEERSALDDAKVFVFEELSGGPQEVGHMFSEGRAAGHSDTTLKRAKAALNVKSEKEKGTTNGGWLWHLPDDLKDELEGGTNNAESPIWDYRQDADREPTPETAEGATWDQ